MFTDIVAPLYTACDANFIFNTPSPSLKRQCRGAQTEKSDLDHLQRVCLGRAAALHSDVFSSLRSVLASSLPLSPPLSLSPPPPPAPLSLSIPVSRHRCFYQQRAAVFTHGGAGRVRHKDSFRLRETPFIGLPERGNQMPLLEI